MRTAVGWWLVVGCLAWGPLGCDDGGSDGSSAPPIPIDQTRTDGVKECTGPEGCQGTLTCERGVCSGCECPVVTCTSSAGCEGTLVCSGGRCDICSCTAPEPAWSVAGSGAPAELKRSPDGSLVVRLLSAPWLVRYSDAGDATPLNLQTGLAWASTFEIAADDSIFLAGEIRPDTAGSAVRVQHLAPDGEALSSAEWQVGGEATMLNALTVDADGQVHALVETIFGRALVALTADSNGDGLVDIPTGATGPLWIPQFPKAKRVAIAPDGSVLVQGGDSDAWLQKVDVSAQPPATAWSLTLSHNAANGSIEPGSLTVDQDGSYYASFGSGWTNASSLLGSYTRSMYRVSSEGASLWVAGDTLRNPRGGYLELNHTRGCVMKASVLLAVGLAAPDSDRDSVLLEPTRPLATVARYRKNGELVQSLALGAITDVVALAGEAAVFLQPDDTVDPPGYTLTRIDFAE